MALDRQASNDAMARLVREEQAWIAGERLGHPQGTSGAARAPIMTPIEGPTVVRPESGAYWKSAEGLIAGGCYG
jgi:hypothetical protein